MGKIGIVGATGRIGRELVPLLRARGAACRVLARDPAKAAAQFPGHEIVRGDLDDPAGLAAAFAGLDKLYLASVVGAQQVKQHSGAFAAAKRAGVRHIVRISTVGVLDRNPVGFGEWHLVSERELEASGMAWTHLRPCNFMHNMLTFAGSIARTGQFKAPLGDRGRLALVDVGDIAAVAAVALTEPGHEKQAYTITGEDWLTYHEVAADISAAIGRTVRYVPVTPEEARRDLAAHGMPPWLIDDLLRMYARLGADTVPQTTDVVRRVARKAPLRFAEFARRFARQFSGAEAPTPH